MFIPMLVLFVFGIMSTVKGIRKTKETGDGGISLVIGVWMVAAAIFLAVPR